MDHPHRMTPRQRLFRLGGGLLLAVAGYLGFQWSAALDPDNRWGLLGILAVVVGASWIGQGVRGRHDGPIPRDVEVPAGSPVGPEKVFAAMVGAWILPGLGHWLLGRRAKAILFFAVITATFLAGILMAQGRNLDYGREPVYFYAYLFNLGETAIAWLLARGIERDHPVALLHVGYLYSAVACLLNLVALMDCLHTTRYAGAPPAPARTPPPGGLPSEAAE